VTPIDIQLRDITEDDFAIFFDYQRDELAARMAAFGTKDADPTTFAARWRAARAEGTAVQKAIVEGHQVVGYVSTFMHDDKLQVTYWIARSHWGRGIATAALSELLRVVTVRPLYASAAHDNVGSLRVLQKCGFTICGSDKAFANARGEEVEEILLELHD